MNTDSNRLHPSNFTPEKWVISRQSIKATHLTVEHHRHEPGELATPGLSHHLLMVRLSCGGARQITRFGQQEYDGCYPVGSFWLVAAQDLPCFWSWKSTDETMLFIIEPLRLQQIAIEQGYPAQPPIELQTILLGRDPHLEILAKQYRIEMQHNGLGGRLYSESLGNLLILHLLRNYCQPNPKFAQPHMGLGDRRLKSVLDYIEAHLDENLGLQDFATLTGLSQCHFATMFKQSMGVAPYRYVLQQRLERAKQYLQSSNQRIHEIALDCGFADQSHLTKHFRKSVGMTPRQFRNL
ncbi:helix-turn-helix transcriptional regulator [filamentous cyanobacterium LEGE 11480]|uniref:Helix-turn-helix transcriptional regulator n=1 Tax=Romeriopsis navalis LEGE 11480 TaxID=2777977 RepID=A0A928Z5T4_9CYAN|nr:AraC family transcriptional regulator [Romeriopsis navalis]MBE9033139.1 helix-turn-helix transcriptional regulator [Romeriopsis navalis LEGE 11480]